MALIDWESDCRAVHWCQRWSESEFFDSEKLHSCADSCFGKKSWTLNSCLTAVQRDAMACLNHKALIYSFNWTPFRFLDKIATPEPNPLRLQPNPLRLQPNPLRLQPNPLRLQRKTLNFCSDCWSLLMDARLPGEVKSTILSHKIQQNVTFENYLCPKSDSQSIAVEFVFSRPAMWPCIVVAWSIGWPTLQEVI